MTTSLTEVVQAVTRELKVIDPKINGYETVPYSPDFPAAFPVPPEIDYRQAMKRGVIVLEFEVVLLAQAVDDDNQHDLLPYLDWTGDESILQHFDANRTLGFPDVDCVVMASRPLGLEEVAGYQGWGAAVTFRAAITNQE